MSEEPQQTLPIDALVRDRCKELGLQPTELLRRCGYLKLPKGLRRLEEVRAGEFERAAELIRRLPDALEVPAAVVKQAIEDTQRHLHGRAEAAWRAAFRPDAVIIPERRIPQPIFVASLIEIDKLLRINLDPAGDPRNYVDQTLNGICAKLARWHAGFDRQKGLGSYALPAFGRPIGFVINYTCDLAVRFDLASSPREVLPTAYRTGQSDLLLRGSPISAEVLQKLFPVR